MRVRVDGDRCTGHGRCYEAAPDVFDADERGHCVIQVADVPADRLADVRLAVENCPEQALTLEG